MRRIATLTSALVVCAALAAGFLAAYSSHSRELKNTSGNCSASCHQQGQPVALNNQSLRDDEDDKEPAPPMLLHLNMPANLVFLYFAPALMLSYSLKNKMLLTSHLRF